MIETNIKSDYHKDYFINPLERLGYRGEIRALITGYSVKLYHDEREWRNAFCNDIYGLEDKLTEIAKSHK